VVFDDKRGAKPLRIFPHVSPNPFTRPLSEWPNEGKRSLWQNPDIGFTRGPAHGLHPVLANGGSGLIGKRGRKTANVCDKHARERTIKTATHFIAVGFHLLSPEIGEQSS
jgi:hypothetical protein